MNHQPVRSGERIRQMSEFSEPDEIMLEIRAHAHLLCFFFFFQCVLLLMSERKDKMTRRALNMQQGHTNFPDVFIAVIGPLETCFDDVIIGHLLYRMFAALAQLF